MEETEGSGARTGQDAGTRHMQTEKRRRDRIASGFETLRDLIPCKDRKLDKATFLQEVVDYVSSLQASSGPVDKASLQNKAGEMTEHAPLQNFSIQIDMECCRRQCNRQSCMVASNHCQKRPNGRFDCCFQGNRTKVLAHPVLCCIKLLCGLCGTTCVKDPAGHLDARLIFGYMRSNPWYQLKSLLCSPSVERHTSQKLFTGRGLSSPGARDTAAGPSDMDRRPSQDSGWREGATQANVGQRPDVGRIAVPQEMPDRVRLMACHSNTSASSRQQLLRQGRQKQKATGSQF